MEVSQLWLQDKVVQGKVKVMKVNGKANKADALTKHMDSAGIKFHVDTTHQVVDKSRHHLAPEMSKGEGGNPGGGRTYDWSEVVGDADEGDHNHDAAESYVRRQSEVTESA